MNRTPAHCRSASCCLCRDCVTARRERDPADERHLRELSMSDLLETAYEREDDFERSGSPLSQIPADRAWAEVERRKAALRADADAAGFGSFEVVLVDDVASA